LVACTFTLTTMPAFAQKEFPSKPIMLVVTIRPADHRRDGPHAGRCVEKQPRPASGRGEPRGAAATSARKSSRAPSPMATR
jgi:hypothetical protein